MLQMVEGPPGAGKSYFAVNYLVGYTKYDELYQEYVLNSDVLIISNIEGLKIRHWSLNQCLELKPHDKLSSASEDRIKEFFSIENFENIQKRTGKKHIILCIDEAHELFPFSFKETSVYEFFAYHRHIGLDVIFLTQGLHATTRLFNPLFEFIIKATPRSKKIGGSFHYKYCDLRGKTLYTKPIRTKKNVFRAYQSFRQDEAVKPKSAVTRLLVFILVCFGTGGLLFWSALNNLDKKANATVLEVEEPGQLDSSVVQVMKPESPINESEIISKYVRKIKPDGTGPDVYRWDRIEFQGYSRVVKDQYLSILGNVVRVIPSRFKNINFDTMTVSYYGEPFIDLRPRDTAPKVETVSKGRAYSEKGER